mmetsp:Transcript_30467/g.72528  ORF Transcript_30467/g.72528 Transcript_30467/m.72528 type:complete len:339 (-) Transcript_30467:44-1060(-)
MTRSSPPRPSMQGLPSTSRNLSDGGRSPALRAPMRLWLMSRNIRHGSSARLETSEMRLPERVRKRRDFAQRRSGTAVRRLCWRYRLVSRSARDRTPGSTSLSRILSSRMCVLQARPAPLLSLSVPDGFCWETADSKSSLVNTWLGLEFSSAKTISRYCSSESWSGNSRSALAPQSTLGGVGRSNSPASRLLSSASLPLGSEYVFVFDELPLLDVPKRPFLKVLLFLCSQELVLRVAVLLFCLPEFSSIFADVFPFTEGIGFRLEKAASGNPSGGAEGVSKFEALCKSSPAFSLRAVMLQLFAVATKFHGLQDASVAVSTGRTLKNCFYQPPPLWLFFN